MDELKVKISFHQEELRKIKKDNNYRKLIISDKDPATRKQLERYKLKIKGHETQIQMAQTEIARMKKLPPRRRIPQVAIRHPPNPVKKYETAKKPINTQTKNNHQILNKTTTSGKILKGNTVNNQEIEDFLNGEIRFDEFDF